MFVTSHPFASPLPEVKLNLICVVVCYVDFHTRAIKGEITIKTSICVIHCNFRCPALKNESIKVGQIINLFFYIDFMVKNCEIVYKSKAPAWAKARPSQAQLLAFGPAHNFLKPKPPKARPKPGLSGQAGASTSLLVSLSSMEVVAVMETWQPV